MYVGILHYHKLKEIESAALRCTDNGRARVACHLGSIASPNKSLGGLGGLWGLAAGGIG